MGTNKNQDKNVYFTSLGCRIYRCWIWGCLLFIRSTTKIR